MTGAVDSSLRIQRISSNTKPNNRIQAEKKENERNFFSIQAENKNEHLNNETGCLRRYSNATLA